MDRLSRERDEDAVRDVRPPEPVAPEQVQGGSMAWASAIGNQAVQRLARQGLEEEEEVPEAPEAEPEVAEPVAEEAGAETVGAVIDDLAEDEIPE
jgi:hypothetical protein